MKWIKSLVLVSALLIAGLVYSQTRVITDEQAVLDQLLASVLSPEPPPPLNLPLVASSDVPELATFWSAQAMEDSPPYPFNPVADLGLPVYSLGANSYLFDDRAVNYQAWRQVQIAVRLLDSGMTLSSLDLPEFPGEGEEGGGEWTNSYVPIVYGSNDLWLELVQGSVTNGTADLIIHNPWDVTNSPVWDLYATTNLNVEWPGLNGTNWTWLLRTDAGQTNVTVPQISEEQAYYRIGETNDLDGDTLPDLYELWVSHSSPSTNDTDGDRLLDGWEWKYFGSFAPGDTEDYDNDGTDNITEQTNSTNPNDLSFRSRFPSFFVNQTNVSGYCEVEAGVPFELAVLVNSTNLAAAQWLPYTGTFATSLGTTDGVYTVRVALRGRDPAFPPVWDDTEIILDRVAPVLAITNPVSPSATVTKPYLQLQGFANEPLASLAYDISNAFGLETNLDAFVTDQAFDTNQFDFTTNWFQAFDVELATNANLITLRVTDRAGNATSTNLTVTLDYSGATSPLVNLTWPTNGLELCGDNFTLRGWTDDEAASVTATLIATTGGTNVFAGEVERSGAVWVENLPLNSGTNWLTLAVTNAAGHGSTTNLFVVKSDMTLTVSWIEGDLWVPPVTVHGAISEPDYCVWVNGVKGTNHGDGTWSVANVPVSAGGVASFDVSAIPPGGGDPMISTNVEKEAAIIMVGYESTRTDLHEEGNGDWWKHTLKTKYRAQPEPGTNGQWLVPFQAQSDDRGTGNVGGVENDPYYAYHRVYEWSPTNATLYEARGTTNYYDPIPPSWNWAPPPIPDEDVTGEGGRSMRHFYADNVRWRWESGSTNAQELSVKARTQMKLYTGGKSKVKRKSLFRITGGATAYGKPQPAQTDWWGTPATIVDPTKINVLGWWLFGRHLDSNGELYRVLPDNADLNLNLRIPGVKHYDASSSVEKIRLDLTQVAFAGSEPVLRDDGTGPYDQLHWQMNETTGVVNSSPVLYVSGSNVQASVVFTNGARGASGVGGDFPLLIKGEVSGGHTSFTLLGTNLTTVGDTCSVTMYADHPLTASKVDYFEPMKIKWYYGYTNKPNYLHAGTSTNQVYVSLRAPTNGVPLYHTVVHISCYNATGETSDVGAADDIFGEFTDRVVRRLSDNAQMTYWFNDHMGSTETSGLLQRADANGNCQSWSGLLRDCFRVQGIAADRMVAMPVAATDRSILVKNWQFDEPPSGTGQYPYIIGTDATHTSGMGIAAQGNSNPPDHFNGHWITLCNGAYYDPSYGTAKVTGSDKDKNYEDQSLAGYGDTLQLDLTGTGARHNDTSSGSSSELTYTPDN